jgi:hypothetical protein
MRTSNFKVGDRVIVKSSKDWYYSDIVGLEAVIAEPALFYDWRLNIEPPARGYVGLPFNEDEIELVKE